MKKEKKVFILRDNNRGEQAPFGVYSSEYKAKEAKSHYAKFLPGNEKLFIDEFVLDETHDFKGD